MDCTEALECLTAFVDGELETHKQPHFRHHIQSCPSCSNEYDLERLTKQLVKQRLKHVQAPGSTVQRIRERIAQEAATEATTSRAVRARAFRMFTASPLRRSVFAMSGAVAILFLFVLFPSRSQHSHTQPRDGDVFHQAYNNFDNVLNGSLAAQITDKDAGALQRFFASKVGFAVNIPQAKHCTIRGTVSNYRNAEIAHIVFQDEEKIVYLYEMNLRDIVEGGPLEMPAEALQELQQTGWYTRHASNDCSLVASLNGSTVCLAVADMDKDQLLSYLR